MKKTNLILLFLLSLAWTGCHKDKVLESKEPEITGVWVESYTNDFHTYAYFGWDRDKFDFLGNYSSGVEVGQREDLGDAILVQDWIDSISYNKQYYYRVVVWNDFSRFTSETFSFVAGQDTPRLPYYGYFHWSNFWVEYQHTGEQYWDLDSVSNTAQISGCVNGINYANESWLSSYDVNIKDVIDAKIILTYQCSGFSNIDEEVTLWVSTDFNYYYFYDYNNIPWNQLPIQLINNGSEVTTEIPLTPFIGNVIRFAVKYVSTQNSAGFIKITGLRIEEGTACDHDYVDFGLPSGTLWATCNVGASLPEDYGDYFAWGETLSKDIYDWNTYKYCNGSNNTLTKYCNNPTYGYNGFTDNLTMLQASDDAATANWGSGWCMPTESQWEELHNSTTVTWTTQNGVNGRKFSASDGKSLFLPAAGYRYEDSFFNAGNYGYYRSSSLDIDIPSSAWDLYFNSDYCSVVYDYRYCGCSVRPVRSSSKN